MVPVHNKGGWQRIISAVKITVTQWRYKVTDLIFTLKTIGRLYDTRVLSQKRLTVPLVSDHHLYYVSTDHPVRARRRSHFLQDD